MFDADSESKKQEIFDLLLVAGYFRIRIPSLTDFDKILGGLSWGILCSGFDIDIDLDYSDEFKLNQKIKLAERVIIALKKMKCPHPLLPFQIQGLDFAAIFSVVQWLLKFVDETRVLRQDTNEMISKEIGDKILAAPKEYFETPKVSIAKIQTKNKKVQKFEFNDPIRVYSALAEMGNKIAASIYQKMSLERSGEGEGVNKNPFQKAKEDATKQSDFVESKGTGSLALDLKAQLQAKNEAKLLPKPQQKTKKKVQETFDEDSEEEIVEVELDDIADFEATRALVRKNSIDADGFMRLLEGNRDNEDVVEQIKEIEEAVEGSGTGSMLQKETLMFQEQKEQIETVIQTANKKIKQYQVILEEVKGEDKDVTKELNQILSKNEELKSKLAKIESGINSRKKKMETEEMREIENTINTIQSLKDEKTRIKTKAKEESKKTEKEIEKYQTQLEKIESGNQVEKISQEYEERRRIYQKKQEQLAQVSQEVALLSRKIQEYPSTVEVGQYYKRYADLFERVAEETENQRKLEAIYNRQCDVQRLIHDHSNILRSIKSQVLECKKEKQRATLASQLEDLCKQTAANLDRSRKAYDKGIEEGADLRAQLDKNLGYQREYYQLLKEIQYEYERLQEG